MTPPKNQEYNRPLNIDFNLHIDGDLKFRSEFIKLLLANMNELHQAWRTAIETNEETLFKRASHKIKPTLLILNDQELSSLVDALNISMADIKINLQFNKICIALIQSLEAEKIR
jgi:hypothetical protein